MRLVHRLVLGSSIVVATVMSIYGVTALRQRRELIEQALVRETETLANSMQIVANSAIRNGQTAQLNRVMDRIFSDPQTSIGAVLDSAGRVMAGGAEGGLGCVASRRTAAGRVPEIDAWADCGGRVRLRVVPLQPPAEALVIARRTTVVERDMAAAARSIVFTSIALAVLGSLAIVAVLRRWLTAPLGEILAGVDRLGGSADPSPIQVPRAAAELQHLARAFNAMLERLEGNQRTLMHEVEERIELERRLRDAESFAALGRLTGGVAHELGSPLGVIRVRAEAIGGLPDSPPAARRHASVISGEVERIERLVRDLVHVARRHGPAAVPTDLGGVVASVAGAFRGDAEAAGIDLRVSLPADPITVRADERLLHHALYGIVLNALQALRSHTGERVVTLDVERAESTARVVVEDTGPGIEPDLFPRVFEPFFTTKDVGDGSGLGLAISAGIAEEHGGKLTLAPAEGGGVRAQLEIPLATREPQPSAA
jgi:signal transduction histidine kinase